MIYSKKELSQLLVEACLAYQIDDIIISPGSRNAPLTLGFVNHPKFTTYSIIDERCAAFFALGLAQQTGKPSVLVCTSGSAVLNYYPAVAEAYYSNIPLIIISADRPKHLIDIGDGQTIRQEKVLEGHCIYSLQLQDETAFMDKNIRQTLKAINLSITKKGPVHINVPFDEPLYETTDRLTIKPLNINKPLPIAFKTGKIEEMASIWNRSPKKMVLIGSNFPDKNFQDLLANFASDPSVLVLTETISNVHHPNFINSIDKLIFSLNGTQVSHLQPDLLLTFGGMVVSKKIKQFLRKHQPKEHWHIHQVNKIDTFHCLTRYLKLPAIEFLAAFNSEIQRVESDYQRSWLAIRDGKNIKHKTFLANVDYCDLKVFELLLAAIPNNSQLQLSNSSVIRYSQLFDINTSVTVFANRGTSGIDGSSSTAIGASVASNKPCTLISGDLSFFYDSNALWNSYIKNDFRIVVINNGGGGIFKIIEGPKETNVLEYFTTPHHLNAAQLCAMYNFDYQSVNDKTTLKNLLATFYEPSKKPKLLEIFTPAANNDSLLKTYFKFL